MRLTRLVLALACSAALTVPALAQTSTTPPTAAPATTAPSITAPSAATPRAASPAAPAPSTSASTAPSATPATGMVNINTASVAQLDKLPQIGKSRAEKIVKGRPYSSPADLVNKKILTKSVYSKIKDKITT
ncbi:MAG TPA: helix-hairpin-helix domain-containing protein [Acetobacteraceae bacterium]|jgi:DNA uptake protein ComE-like DNA-binding protein|nr:helix-hairpin-helix domain-containing protein [Acetobacteraceae bacterium]